MGSSTGLGLSRGSGSSSFTRRQPRKRQLQPMNKALADKTGSPDQVHCDVVVVSYNQRDRLLACLESAVGTNPKVRLIVIDNASVDDSAQAVATAYPDATLVTLPENVGFAAAVNRGVAIGVAPHILLLNNDARLGPDALDRMRQALGSQRVAAVGPHLLGPDGQTELSLDRTLSFWSEAMQIGRASGRERV